jgi:hypothetical protein
LTRQPVLTVGKRASWLIERRFVEFRWIIRKQVFGEE